MTTVCSLHFKLGKLDRFKEMNVHNNPFGSLLHTLVHFHTLGSLQMDATVWFLVCKPYYDASKAIWSIHP